MQQYDPWTILRDMFPHNILFEELLEEELVSRKRFVFSFCRYCFRGGLGVGGGAV